jgi:hypothetical protein
VPRWLLIGLLAVAVILFVTALSHFAYNPENGPPAP